MPLPELITARLLLRGFTADDASSVRSLAGAFEVADTTLQIPHPYPDGAAEAWIAAHEASFESGAGAAFAITLKTSGELVGTISLMSIEAGHQGELGYWIGVPYWGQGLCTEAGQAMVDYAFTGLGLARVHASHFSRNPASGRVLEKLGFIHEGTRRGHVRKWGKLEDLEIYGLVRDT